MEIKNNQSVYWTRLVHEDWKIYVAATEKGLCYVSSQNQPFDELAEWVKNRLPNHVLIQDDEKLKSYVIELIEYLQGKRQSFTVPADLHGTPFQLSVWDALCKIPYGRTYSYSDIANHIEKPDAVRAVGTAIGANPALITVPCHRVIGKNGALTGYRGGLEMKTKLLSLEKERSNTEGRITNA
ncbi:methylated-DNA--[protein]-cysteine S-methyltransferase [Ectobacillus panaciterrae]|uniref:methylated-DNA--[protein]-cysteine S-methyltransferase n=1 Tax=Ectobacillus panaciterrae TaxID=363872 RepID=UPI000406E874|nr:methylated-DNA--[protein]-cysteine S-methyltransferase [Ectobacillus panaciterrae]